MRSSSGARTLTADCAAVAVARSATCGTGRRHGEARPVDLGQLGDGRSLRRAVARSSSGLGSSGAGCFGQLPSTPGFLRRSASSVVGSSNTRRRGGTLARLGVSLRVARPQRLEGDRQRVAAGQQGFDVGSLRRGIGEQMFDSRLEPVAHLTESHRAGQARARP